MSIGKFEGLFLKEWLAIGMLVGLSLLMVGCGKKEIKSEEEDFIEKAMKVGLSEEESRALRQKMILKDSLRPLFCACILDDKLTQTAMLTRVDELLAAGLTTDFNCKSTYLQSRPVLLQKLGNAILPGNPFDDRPYTRENAYYPVTMLFQEDSVMVRALANRGFRIDARSRDIISLLEYWIRKGDRSWVTFLMNFEVDFNRVRLFTTDEPLIDYLLQQGALEKQINGRLVLEDDRREQLMEKYEIDLSRLDCFDIELLLIPRAETGVDLERANMLREYDLAPECFVNRRIMKYILDQRFPGRVKFDQRDSYREAWLSFYQKEGIDWHFCDDFGENPLMRAVEKADLALVQQMIQYGADPRETCTRFDKPYNVLDFTRKELESLEGLNSEAWDERREQLKEILKFLEELA